MKIHRNKVLLLLLLYLVPIFLDDHQNLEEIVWLLYIFPAVLLPFYYGIKGGILAAVVGTCIHAAHEFMDISMEHKIYSSVNIGTMVLVTLINLTVALIIGTLVEKLKKEQLTLKKAIAKMEFMAFHDSLTGLPNRWNFEAKLKAALKEVKENGKLAAVLFIDLDRFKLINDSYGHYNGDQLLKDVAKRISTHLEDGDFLARQGGDEFILFLSNIHSKAEAAERVGCIHQSIQAPFYVKDHEFLLSSSIGISLFPDDGDTLEDLIQQADIAMYSAKEQGKNGFQFYNTEKLKEINDVVKIETHLRKALYQNEFSLHYQPLINLRSNKIIGMEALIRWNNPELGSISPDVFIPLAEEIGIIGKLGEWVLKEACSHAKKLSETMNNPMRVAVNISSKQFKDSHFVDIIRNVLAETSLLPNQLELEITESVSLENIEEVIFKLNILKKMGITIAMDDFGTGYSSLSYLKNLPIDTLKIDQSFVLNMLTNSKDRALVESVISLSKNFGFNVTAEGVETIEHLNLLKAFHCGQAQGYLFSKPLPYHDFYQYLMNYNEQENYEKGFASS